MVMGEIKVKVKGDAAAAEGQHKWLGCCVEPFFFFKISNNFFPPGTSSGRQLKTIETTSCAKYIK